MQTLTFETLEQKIQKVKEILELKSPGNWYFEDEFFNFFNSEVVCTEIVVDFEPTINILENYITSEREILNRKDIIKLPLLQALDVIVEIIKNDEVGSREILIPISTKRRFNDDCGCYLTLRRTRNGRFYVEGMGVALHFEHTHGTRILCSKK